MSELGGEKIGDVFKRERRRDIRAFFFYIYLQMTELDSMASRIPAKSN